MSSPLAILSRCRRLGLTVWAEGERIGIAPKERIPPDLLDEIRAAKTVLLPLMRDGQTCQSSDDCIPWLHIARQILTHEFDGGDRSLLEALWIGVRNIPHPVCQQAREHLEKLRPEFTTQQQKRKDRTP